MLVEPITSDERPHMGICSTKKWGKYRPLKNNIGGVEWGKGPVR